MQATGPEKNKGKLVAGLLKVQLFVAVLFVGLCVLSGAAQAISLPLNGARTILSGSDCSTATYRFGTSATYDGQALDVLVEVLQEDNEQAGSFQCLGVEDGVLFATLRDKNFLDNIAYQDLQLTVVRQGTTTPVVVDRLIVTGFDLDASSNTGSDDLYFNTGEKTRSYVSVNTETTVSATSTGGYNTRIKGRDTDCTDGAATVEPECRASVVFSETSSASLRVQNDNAYGRESLASDSRRVSYLSLRVDDFDDVVEGNTDYGDAPAPYVASRQAISSFLGLGAGLVPDHDGAQQASGGADGDDLDGSGGAVVNFDDEDGATLAGNSLNDQKISPGQQSELSVTTYGSGYLNVWFDWNRDGDFSDAGERMVSNRQVTNNGETSSGNNSSTFVTVTPVAINVPLSASSGMTYARFKFTESTNPGVGSSGDNGEVEDYRVTVEPAPFQCTNTLYQVATASSLLRRIDFAGSSASFVDVGPGAGETINAGWGYNDQDGFIHGLKSGSNELWFIDANGNFYNNGTPAGLPSGRNGSNAGDVLPDGRMMYKTANNRLSVIDLTDSPPSYQGDIALSASPTFIDMAYNPVDGRVYSIDSRVDRLFWIDLATGQITYFGPAEYSGSFGAQWFDENGRFYAYENGANELYYIDVGVDGSGSGNSVLLAASSNTAGGINDGAFCRGEAPIPLGALSGKVYQDLDGSDVFDSGEPGLASIQVELYRDNGTPSNMSDDVLIGSMDTDNNGDYLFPAVLAGQTYRVEVNSSDPDLPSGAALGTASPLVGISVQEGVDASDNNFGFDILDIILSGWVFEDNGVDATAHDGVKEQNEPGLANVAVTLYHDSDSNGACSPSDPVLALSQTSGDGAFSLSLAPMETGKAVCLVAETPSGFVSVSENGGALPATTGGVGDDVQTMTLPAPGAQVTGLLFGDAGLPILEPDQQGVLSAGGSRFYSHRFTARSAGDVNFVLDAATTSPATPVWNDTLYRDDNCNGVLDGADASLPLTGVTVAAGEQRCLLVKTFAPGNAPVGALHTRPLSATQAYTGTAFLASAQVVDITRIAAGELALEKRVQNLTAGSAEGTSNQADPGDVLRYRLVFRNQGSSALAEVVINDNTPAFTSLNGAVACPPLPLPALLSGCTVNTSNGVNGGGYQGAIEWTFTGELQPGAEGEVSYDVKVDE